MNLGFYLVKSWEESAKEAKKEDGEEGMKEEEMEEEETETSINRGVLVKGEGVPKEKGESDTTRDRNSNTRLLARRSSLQKGKSNKW